MKKGKIILEILIAMTILIGTSMVALAKDQVVLYDSISSAKAITISQPVSDSLTSDSYTKCYSITANNNGVLELSFSHEKMPGVSSDIWSVSLVNELDKEFASFNSKGNTEKMSMTIGLPKGTYYIRVNAYNRYESPNYNNINYEIMPKFTATEYCEKEFNDNMDVANNLELNNTYNGSIRNASDVDYYSIKPDNNGCLNLSFSHEILAGVSEALWKITVENKLGKVLKTVDSLGNVENVNISVGVPKGEYIILVEPYTSYFNEPYYKGIAYKLLPKFTIGDNFEQEFNDNKDVANDILVNKKYTASLQRSNDTDYYSFTIKNNGLVTLDFNHEKLPGMGDSYWKISLVNELEKEFQTIESKGNVEKTSMTVGLSPGKYYVVIKPENSYNGYNDVDYNLTINYDQSEIYEKEFNDNIDVPNSLKANVNYSGMLQRRDDEDYYVFNSNGTNNLKFTHDKLPGVGDYVWGIDILSSSKKVLMSYACKGNDAGDETGILPKGKYYIRVKSYISYEDNAVGVKYNLVEKTVNINKEKVYSKICIVNVYDKTIYGVTHYTELKTFVKNIYAEKGATVKVYSPWSDSEIMTGQISSGMRLYFISKDKKTKLMFTINLLNN